MSSSTGKSERFELTSTPPTAHDPRLEREVSYFGQMWPHSKCPPDLSRTVQRHNTARSQPETDFTRHHPAPAKRTMTVAQRLAFERDSGEANT